MNLLSPQIVWNTRERLKTLWTTWIPLEIPRFWKRHSGLEACSRTHCAVRRTSPVFRPVSGLRGTQS